MSRLGVARYTVVVVGLLVGDGFGEGGRLWGAATVAPQASVAVQERLVSRAERLWNSGMSGEAVALLRAHLDREPGSVAVLALLGEIELDQGMPDLLIPYAERTVAALPSDGAARAWWARAVLASGRVDSATAIATRWLAASPEAAEARMVLSEVALARGDSAAAIRVLRDHPEPHAVLSTRLSSLLLAQNEHDDLFPVWKDLLALGPTGEASLVTSITGAGPGVGGDFLRSLRTEDVDLTRKASLVALRSGMHAEARMLAEVSGPPADVEDAGFLRQYVREAEDAGARPEVAWGAGQLATLSRRPADRVRWLSVVAENQAASGHLGDAARTLEDITDSDIQGTTAHMQATLQLFQIHVEGSGSLGEAEELLERFSDLYPDSARTAAVMWGNIALGHARQGDLTRAQAVLDEARASLLPSAFGPLDAAGARVSFYSGDREAALVQAERSVGEADLEPAERTARLALQTFLTVADTLETRIAGAAAAALLTDPAGFDPGPTMRELAGAPTTRARPLTLTLLAREADAVGRVDVAAPLRRQIVTNHPESPEAPAALLELARGAGADEAATLLERLIVEYPGSALAPIARRMLASNEPGS